MCGIHGAQGGQAGRVQRMIEACAHRGPDGSSLVDLGSITLGHNLLAIVNEPALSRQPFPALPGWLVYNGEIYNGPELCKWLGVPRDNFRTDTELLAFGLQKRGIDFLRRVDGMFALAWQRDGKVLLARDVSGAKPLYYTTQGGRLIFSSELRGLRAAGVPPVLDPFGFQLYLEFGYLPGWRTIYQDVRKLVPGEFLELNLDGGVAQRGSLLRQPTDSLDFDPHVFRETLRESVRRCLVGIRPIGLYLSGGLDSGAILHELHTLGKVPQTLTVRFSQGKPGQGEDADAAALMAQRYGSQHCEILYTEEEFAANVHPALYAQDGPLYNRGMAAYYRIHREASRQGLVVVLTGDGGDEVLSGYRRHSKVCDPRRAKAGGREIEELYRVKPDGYDPQRPIWRWHWISRRGGTLLGPPDKAAAFLEQLGPYMSSWVPNRIFNGDVLHDQLSMELLTHCAEDYLMRNDKLGMHFGLEARMPLLADPFRSYALALRSDFKLQEGTTKPLARRAYCNLLPEQVLAKAKSGWSPPTGAWMDQAGPLGRSIAETVKPGRYPGVERLVDYNKVWQTPKMLFALYHFLAWADLTGLQAD